MVKLTRAEWLQNRAAYKRRWRAAKPHLARANNMWCRYKIRPADYDALLTKQENACAICRSTDPGRNRKHMSVDHDHRTGKVRALLCAPCNVLVGLAESQHFGKIAGYLASH